MIVLDRAKFFHEVRNGPFPGRLTQAQVDGMNDLLDEWLNFGTEDPRHLAYTFATSFHETGQRMQPVREGFGRSDADARARVKRLAEHRGPNSAVAKYAQPAGTFGHWYYGRGDVQLTWLDNYERMGSILDLPLVEKPDLALKYSKRILIEGMLDGASNRGDFTGKSLEDYFNENDDDPVGARRIVNGTDKARQIAGYHNQFLEAVQASQIAVGAPERKFDDVVAASARSAKLDPVDAPDRIPDRRDKVTWGTVLTGAGGVGGIAAVGSDVVEQVQDPYTLAALGIIVLGVVLTLSGRLELKWKTGE